MYANCMLVLNGAFLVMLYIEWE